VPRRHSTLAPDWPALAADVIARADRAHPADAVLREAVRRAGGVGEKVAREASRAVFAYYRWRGWLDPAQSVARQIEAALELAAEFQFEPARFTDAELAARAVPGWTREEMEVPAAWLRAIQAEPAPWLRAKRGQGRALAAALGDCERPPEPRFADALHHVGGADLFRTAAFHAGEFEIQDIASQAVGFACDPQPGETWWDACAGEGGKLLHLSDLMQNKGLIWASDRAAWRLKQLKRRAARAKCFNYRAVLWDGTARLPTKTKFDGVLVDAPCSGVGTWQRNPHARWTTTPEDVHELAAVQRRLLAHVAPSVKPGGKLVYAVCTMTRAETRAVVEAFNTAQADFEPLVLPDVLAREAPTSELMIWPQDLGGSGMFIAAWRRKAGAPGVGAAAI
jgi:16S rRNA (cytosine967-C5)-methyltransferase